MVYIFKNSAVILSASIASVYPGEIDQIESSGEWKKGRPTRTVGSLVHSAKKTSKHIIGTTAEIVTGSKVIKNYLEDDTPWETGFLSSHRLEFSKEEMKQFLSSPLSYVDQHMVYDFYRLNGKEWGKSLGRFLGSKITGVGLGYGLGTGAAIGTLGVAAPLIVPLKIFGSSIGGMVGHVVGAEVGECFGELIGKAAVSLHKKGFYHKDEGEWILLSKSQDFSYTMAHPVIFLNEQAGEYVKYYMNAALSRPAGALGRRAGGITFKVLQLPFKQEAIFKDKQAYKRYKHYNKFLKKQSKNLKKGKPIEPYSAES